MAIEWSDNLSTGVAEIDNQHKELFRRINDLFDACNQGKGKSEVAGVMEFLESYVVEHFGKEENYMKNTAMPAIPAIWRTTQNLLKTSLS